MTPARGWCGWHPRGNAELACAAAYGKSEDARDADNRHDQRDSREAADQRVQPPRREHFSANVFESGGALNRLVLAIMHLHWHGGNASESKGTVRKR
jgi:hypothetical protein